MLCPAVISKERHPYSEPWRLNSLNALLLLWLRGRYRNTCGSKTTSASSVAIGLAHPSGRLLLQSLQCGLTVQLFSIALSIIPLSGTCTVSLTLKMQPECRLWLGDEEERREALSYSSLETNLGTVVSGGCNYEYYLDSLVLGKGISGRYIMVEALTILLCFLCVCMCLVCWLGALPPGISTWRLVCFLLRILCEKYNFIFLIIL